MARPASPSLTPHELAIMQVLWRNGEASVAEVRDQLDYSRPLAYTTVATMLTKMEANGQVTRRTEGRVNIYRAAIQETSVNRSMVTDLAGRLFGGDVTQMVSHLLDGCDVSRDELDRLKSLIHEKEKEVDNRD